jgi:hypothetical protein
MDSSEAELETRIHVHGGLLRKCSQKKTSKRIEQGKKS